MSAVAAPAAAGRVLVPWLERLARLAFALLIVVLPFRARSPVLAMPPDAVSSVLVDLVIYAVDVLVVATLVPWLLGRGLGRRRSFSLRRISLSTSSGVRRNGATE